MTTAHLDINRIVVTADVFSADGKLRVQAGARGVIAGRDGDRYFVAFDRSDHFVELDTSRRRHQSVPVASTQYEAVFDHRHSTKTQASL